MDDKKIIKKIEGLIKIGKQIAGELHSFPYEYSSYKRKNQKYYREARKWEGIISNLLEVRFRANSKYSKDFLSALSTRQDSGDYYKENMELAIGVLEYIYDALKEGLTEDLFYQRELLIFSDLLQQAYEFLDKGLKDAAAIYGRIVLEITIREFASKNNIQDSSFDQLIIRLRTEKIIHQPFETSLRANYKIGSLAVHGKEEFKNISNIEIKEYLNFVRDKVLILK